MANQQYVGNASDCTLDELIYKFNTSTAYKAYIIHGERISGVPSEFGNPNNIIVKIVPTANDHHNALFTVYDVTSSKIASITKTNGVFQSWEFIHQTIRVETHLWSVSNNYPSKVTEINTPDGTDNWRCTIQIRNLKSTWNWYIFAVYPGATSATRAIYLIGTNATASQQIYVDVFWVYE